MVASVPVFPAATGQNTLPALTTWKALRAHLAVGHSAPVAQLLELGSALLQAPSPAEAAEVFHLVLVGADQVAADHTVSAHYGLAMALTQLGRLPDAVAHYRHALAMRLALPVPPCAPGAPRATWNAAVAQALLWHTLAQLAQAGVQAFATSGTLLGLTRTGALLPHDKDLDVGLPWAQMAQACDCLATHGWLPQADPMGLVNPRAWHQVPHGITLDLCGFASSPDNQALVGGLWKANLPWEWQRLTDYPAPLRLHLAQSPAGTVWALDDPAQWLQALYGNWQIPDPDFDTVVAARNLRGFSWLTQCYAWARLNRHWMTGRTRQALSLARHVLRHGEDDALTQQLVTRLENVLAEGGSAGARE